MKKALYISRYIFTMICLITQTAHQINAMRQTVYNRQIKNAASSSQQRLVVSAGNDIKQRRRA